MNQLSRRLDTRRRNRRLLLERLEDRSLLAALPAATFAPGEILIGFDGDIAQQFRTHGARSAIQAVAARFGGNPTVLETKKVKRPADETLH